jgi:hypothetical protein
MTRDRSLALIALAAALACVGPACAWGILLAAFKGK